LDFQSQLITHSRAVMGTTAKYYKREDKEQIGLLNDNATIRHQEY